MITIIIYLCIIISKNKMSKSLITSGSMFVWISQHSFIVNVKYAYAQRILLFPTIFCSHFHCGYWIPYNIDLGRKYGILHIRGWSSPYFLQISIWQKYGQKCGCFCFICENYVNIITTYLWYEQLLEIFKK